MNCNGDEHQAGSRSRNHHQTQLQDHCRAGKEHKSLHKRQREQEAGYDLLPRLHHPHFLEQVIPVPVALLIAGFAASISGISSTT
jgi:hypothetical protein